MAKVARALEDGGKDAVSLRGFGHAWILPFAHEVPVIYREHPQPFSPFRFAQGIFDPPGRREPWCPLPEGEGRVRGSSRIA